MALAVGLIGLVLCALAGEARAGQCPANAKAMARTELLFGAAHVGQAAWKEFLAREVTPRFPDGLTVLDGYGQWRGASGAIAREPSRVLLLWHTSGAKADAAIDAIREAYKRRFHQQSVMRVDGEDCVSF